MAWWPTFYLTEWVVIVGEPIDPGFRLAISQWPGDAPREALSAFRVEHDISRKSFYK